MDFEYFPDNQIEHETNGRTHVPHPKAQKAGGRRIKANQKPKQSGLNLTQAATAFLGAQGASMTDMINPADTTIETPEIEEQPEVHECKTKKTPKHDILGKHGQDKFRNVSHSAQHRTKGMINQPR